MNDSPSFDRFLESELRQMLDHVTAAPAPAFRARRRRTGTPFVTVVTGPIERAAEMVVGAEAAVVPVPVNSAGLLP